MMESWIFHLFCKKYERLENISNVSSPLIPHNVLAIIFLLFYNF
jgi:hypothetical protein